MVEKNKRREVYKETLWLMVIDWLRDTPPPLISSRV